MDRIRLDLIVNGVARLIQNQVSARTGSYTYTVPELQIGSTHAIRISDASDPSISDQESFRIESVVPASVNVLSQFQQQAMGETNH